MSSCTPSPNPLHVVEEGPGGGPDHNRAHPDRLHGTGTHTGRQAGRHPCPGKRAQGRRDRQGLAARHPVRYGSKPRPSTSGLERSPAIAEVRAPDGQRARRLEVARPDRLPAPEGPHQQGALREPAALHVGTNREGEDRRWSDVTCCAQLGLREGRHLCCTLPVNHMTLLEHYDGNRGLPLGLGVPSRNPDLHAASGTEADRLAAVRGVRVDRFAANRHFPPRHHLDPLSRAVLASCVSLHHSLPMSDEQACVGTCNRAWREAREAFKQALAEYGETGRLALQPVPPHPPISIQAWPGNPRCGRCKSRIRETLAELDILASLLAATADGHRAAPGGQRARDHRPDVPLPSRG